MSSLFGGGVCSIRSREIRKSRAGGDGGGKKTTRLGKGPLSACSIESWHFLHLFFGNPRPIREKACCASKVVKLTSHGFRVSHAGVNLRDGAQESPRNNHLMLNNSVATVIQVCSHVGQAKGLDQEARTMGASGENDRVQRLLSRGVMIEWTVLRTG